MDIFSSSVTRRVGTKTVGYFTSLGGPGRDRPKSIVRFDVIIATKPTFLLLFSAPFIIVGYLPYRKCRFDA